MNEGIKNFISRLKTVKNKACDERCSVLTVYNRIKKGIYKEVVIDGVKFVLEEETK